MEDSKVQYEAPEIVEIGKAEELTQGGGGAAYKERDGDYAYDADILPEVDRSPER